jgi:dihydroorotase-like cyclic amidohydrolase
MALVHARVYPSPKAQPIENATILIHDGQIVAVGPATKVRPAQLSRTVRVIDCKGRVVTAGFWNSHVHFTEPEWNDAEHAPAARLEQHMQRMLTAWGFTTVFDIGSNPNNTLALKKRVELHEVLGPKIYTTAGAIYPKDGIPMYLPPDVAKLLKPQEAETAADGARLAKQSLELGGDGIKVFAGAIKRGGVVPMPVEVIRAAANVAHAAGKPVFAHPSNHVGTDNALAGGAGPHDSHGNRIHCAGTEVDELAARSTDSHDIAFS